MVVLFSFMILILSQTVGIVVFGTIASLMPTGTPLVVSLLISSQIILIPAIAIYATYARKISKIRRMADSEILVLILHDRSPR